MPWSWGWAMRTFSGFDHSISTDSIGPSFRVTNSFQFAWDFPSFSTLVSVSQEIPQFQANQDNLAGIVLVFKSKTHILKTSSVRGTPAWLGSLPSFQQRLLLLLPQVESEAQGDICLEQKRTSSLMGCLNIKVHRIIVQKGLSPGTIVDRLVCPWSGHAGRGAVQQWSAPLCSRAKGN